MNKGKRIYVAGHRGMVGSALVRLLAARGFQDLVTASHAELDLCDAAAVRSFLRERRPDAVIVADVTGYAGRIDFDSTKPDGPPRKLCDISQLQALGWRPAIPLREVLEMTYVSFCGELARGAART